MQRIAIRLAAAMVAAGVASIGGAAVAVASTAGESVAGGAAGRSYDADTVIVKYRRGAEPRPGVRLLERAGVERTVEELPLVDAEVVAVERAPRVAVDRLERSPRVAYAEPNFLLYAQAPPNDARFRELWGLHNVGQTGGKRGADIRAVKGWQWSGVGNFPPAGGVSVGIIDTGVDAEHLDLLGRIAACAESRPRSPGSGPSFRVGTCFDDTGHGTHVAGTLGAAANNGQGVAGVAFNSPLIVCRALGGTDQSGRVSDIVRCIGWVRESGARVISMSFAGGRSETLLRALKRAWRGGAREGAVLLAASGNNHGYHASYPAAYPQVISVAATNDRDRHARFSNRHRTVELAAPGVSILSTRQGGGYERLSGTSMAVPHAAGVAAQLRRLHPSARADRIRTIVRRSADDLGRRGHDPVFGYGRVNFARAAAG